MKSKPIPTLSAEQIERFWSRVDKRGPSECWPWLSYLDVVGYGAFRSTNTTYLRPHRVAYTLAVGQIPEGYTIDHVKARGCTLKSCCNPAHLEAVTQSENVNRLWRGTKKTQCKCGQPRRDSGKDTNCRDCHNAYMRQYGMKWRKRRKAA